MYVMGKYYLKKNRYSLIHFLLFLLPTLSYAQFNHVLDSIGKLNTTLEKISYIIGTTDVLILFDSEIKLKTYTDTLIQSAKNNGDLELLEFLEFRKNHYLLTYQKSNEERIYITQKLIDNHLNKGNFLFAGIVNYYLAQLYFTNQQYGYAFEHYLSTYKTFETLGFENTPNIDMFLHDYALANFFFKNYKEVIRLMHISLKFPASNKRHHIQRFNNLGLSHFRLGELDSALFYLEKTSQYAHKYNDSDWQGISAGNIGNIFFAQENYVSALNQYKQQYEYIKNTHYESVLISSLLNIAKSYVMLDSISTAKNYLDQVEELFNNLSKKRRYGEIPQLKHAKNNYYQTMSNLYAKLNHLEKALIYRDSSNELQRLIDEEYNSAVIQIASDKATIEQAKKELETAQKTKDRQRFVYLTIILSAFLLMIIIYTKYKISVKRKQIDEEILKNLNKKTETEKQNLTHALNKSMKELEEFKAKVSELSTNVELLEPRLEQQKETSTHIENINEDAHPLEKLKSSKILTDEDWVKFQSNFKTVYPHLTQEINNAVPIFTIAEKRYLMLTKLGFNNRDMAKIVGVSEGAMRITWKRIREKLNIISKITPLDLINEIEKKTIQ